MSIHTPLLGPLCWVQCTNRCQQEGYWKGRCAIPPTNPVIGYSDVQPEIWAYGLRNPWRCSVDRGDRESGEGAGRVFCGDVGQGSYEEIDIIEVGGNYAWRVFEGYTWYDGNLCSKQNSIRMCTTNFNFVASSCVLYCR